MTRRIALLVAALFAAVAATAGCSRPAPVAYAPAAYGEVVNGVGHCYYDDDPYEAQQLFAQGLCPAGWVPTPMPLYWHERYYSYYSSPAYYNTYVIASHRTVYVTHETTFRTTYSSQITAQAKTATWKGSNGKTVSGSKVNTAKMKFSTGSGSTGQVGSGNLRGGTTGGSGGSGGVKVGSSPAKPPAPKAGSVGGGNLRGRK